MIEIVTITHSKRVAVVRDGRFQRLLGPGRHVLWTIPTWLSGAVLELFRLDVDTIAKRVAASDAVPAELPGAQAITIDRSEIGVLTYDGVDHQLLTPGRYRVWETAAGHQLKRFDVLAEPAILDPQDRLSVGAGSAWTEATADAHSAVVLLRDGLPLRALAPGRYRAWRSGPWSLQAVSLQQQVIELAAQDVVTRDQVPVRVKPAVALVVTDPVVHLRERQGQELVYGAVQLALREVLAGHDLDHLTEARSELSASLLARARAALAPVGLSLTEVWVKDIILSGELKELVGRVVKARKEAQAHSIKRREEVAATRQLANTAKLLESSPVLLRLKELEAMGELVGKIDKLIVVGGPDLADSIRLRTVTEELG